MLKISAAKVAHAIARAREHDTVTGSWENRMQQAFDDDAGDSGIDEFTGNTARGALAEYLSTLDIDEQASLLAIVWIARGAYTPDHLDEAIDKAKSEQNGPSGYYLPGIPLLAEYLHEGMEKLGCPLPILQ
jgi:uncharacterized protein DUF3775